MFGEKPTVKVTLPCGCRKWVGPLAGRAFYYDYGSDMCPPCLAAARAAYQPYLPGYTYPSIVGYSHGSDEADEAHRYRNRFA